MTEARSFLATFFASALAMAAAMPVIGNSLPDPFGTYVPMTADHDFVRNEFVLRNAVQETPTPCIGFFGDSRTAFNISAAMIDQVLPDDCKAQNYGFAALGLHQVRQIFSKIDKIGTAVICVSERMVNPGELRLVTRVLGIEWIRYLYLGHQRVVFLYRTLTGSAPPDSGWSWSTAEKRWRFAGLERRDVDSDPAYYARSVDLMSADYFKSPQPGDGRHLREFLSFVSAKAKRVIVIIPPSEEQFRKVSERYNGKQTSFWRTTERVAREAGAMVVDCSQSCVDRTAFADPVHLNDRGVAMYSAWLAKNLPFRDRGEAGR